MYQQSQRELQLAICGTDADLSLAQTTKIKYRSALISYLNFCHLHKLSTIPTVETISRFISITCRTPSSKTGQPISPRSIEAYLSGIAHSLQPLHPKVREITNHETVRAVLKGCKRQFSKPITRKEPLSLEDIIVVHSACDRSHDELLFLTLLSVGFHALHRLGELTQPDSSKTRDSRKVINRTSIKFSRCGKFARYILPHNKSDQFFLGAQVLLASCDITGALVKKKKISFPILLSSVSVSLCTYARPEPYLSGGQLKGFKTEKELGAVTPGRQPPSSLQ